MPGKYCCVCKNNLSKDPQISLHRFPSNKEKRSKWLEVFQMSEDQMRPHMRVCSRHFPDGDASRDPTITLGKRFCSPAKKDPRTKRAVRRRQLSILSSTSPSSVSPCSSRSETPAPPSVSSHQQESDQFPSSSTSSAVLPSQPQTSVLVHTALLARIELLEAQNASLKKENIKMRNKMAHFEIEQIHNNDKLVHFYTGFMSYGLFLSFFEFLGPVVDHLVYWGSKEGQHKKQRTRKLNSVNQLFLTLVKLRLNLKLKDLAFRFGLSTSQTSRYLTTWICFLYKHLSELDWMPTVKQVAGTLPSAFRDKYASTYAIIDGTEIFIETPSDLHMQSSTWSQYKHHNTTKFLVACTPNGAICYVSPLYVGSISDVELTSVCGFLTELEDKPGISIMADRGFMVKDMLKAINVELNLPPFMEGRSQLPSQEVEQGRRIASLRIHVERAIGRIKTYGICKGTIPISVARISNQIVCVCAFLSNFQPALVPPSTTDETTESDVDEYFDKLSLSDTESCSD